jgi:dTDP-4-amino-4,6-dideoxygalactose transaminase
MTEMQAAILLAQLTRLERQAQTREKNGLYLDEKLKGIPGIRVLKRDRRVTRHAYHLYIIRYIQDELDGLPREKFIKALQAEGIPAWAGYHQPLYKNPLFLKTGKGPKNCPVSCPYYGKTISYGKVYCPNSEKICRQSIWLAQNMLLAGKNDMADIVRAVEKVVENRAELCQS